MSIRRSSGQGLATVALDASVLINILILNRVAILAELPGYRFVVLDAVSILSRAVKTGVISLGELRDAKAKLERNRLRMPLGTFDDLFSG